MSKRSVKADKSLSHLFGKALNVHGQVYPVGKDGVVKDVAEHHATTLLAQPVWSEADPEGSHAPPAPPAPYVARAPDAAPLSPVPAEPDPLHRAPPAPQDELHKVKRGRPRK